jgi:ATP-dependent Clp protease ATP-binding subunit ClpC
MKYDKFTDRCIKKATAYAKLEDKDIEVRVSHLVYAILTDSKSNLVIEVLKDLNVDIPFLVDQVMEIRVTGVKEVEKGVEPKINLTLQAILDYGQKNTWKYEDKDEASVEDVFHGIMKIPNELSLMFLDLAIEPVTFKETLDEIDEELQENLEEYQEYVTISASATNNQTNTQQTKTEFIDKYCTNLNKAALRKEIEFCFGREYEMNQMYRILLRTKKSNIMLIGREGVGKTNMLEGLACNIVGGDCPQDISNKTIYSLNMNSLVAGTKYRGMFEERMEGILKELSATKNNILFIDEIHNIIGTGSAEGSSDLANILKPYITSNKFQIIGATTLAEYKKYLENDKALQRRFSEVLIQEPSKESCLKILRKLKGKYESAHNVEFSDDVLKACVDLSEQYIPYRCLPDKAIDLMDDVAAKVKLQVTTSNELTNLKKQFRDVENIKAKIVSTKCYEKAEYVLEQEDRVLGRIKKEQKRINKVREKRIELTVEDVRNVVEEVTKIPISNGGLNVVGIKQKLQSSIIGQDNAIDSIIRTLTINKLQLNNIEKPIGSFLFVGYSGVGKTQLAKELCKSLFGNEKYLVRFDCSEYAREHEVAKLIGAPNGYVGYGDGGLLTEPIKRNAFSVILFDEIEKANDKLFDILLQVMGEGRLTDSKGETINFKNTIIILTSNIGTKQSVDLQSKLGFNKHETTYDKAIVEKEIGKRFRIEFLNRIDNTIHFNALDKTAMLQILDLELNNLIAQTAKHEILLSVSNEVKEYLVNDVTPEKGFRQLQRKINDELKMIIADKIIENFTGQLDLNLVDGKVVARELATM